MIRIFEEAIEVARELVAAMNRLAREIGQARREYERANR